MVKSEDFNKLYILFQTKLFYHHICLIIVENSSTLINHLLNECSCLLRWEECMPPDLAILEIDLYLHFMTSIVILLHTKWPIYTIKLLHYTAHCNFHISFCCHFECKLSAHLKFNKNRLACNEFLAMPKICDAKMESSILFNFPIWRGFLRICF